MIAKKTKTKQVKAIKWWQDEDILSYISIKVKGKNIDKYFN